MNKNSSHASEEQHKKSISEESAKTGTIDNQNNAITLF